MLISESLRANKSFTEDLKRFLDTPIEALNDVNQVLDHDKPSIKDEDISKIAKAHEIKSSDLIGATRAFVYLRSKVLATRSTGAAVLDELEETMGQSIESQKRSRLEELFGYTDEESLEALSAQAFSTGSTFISLQILPALVLSPDEEDLIPGFMAHLRYVDSGNDLAELTLGLGIGDLAGFESAIRDAKKMMEKVRSLKEISHDDR